MEDQKRVNIAQIGCGYWGPNLARNVAENPGAELVAACDKVADVLQRIADKYPDVLQFTSLEETLAHPAIDAVIIATPSGLHYEHVLAALQAGKHVLVEKPMASSVKQALKLVDAAERLERVLMVGHTFLYNNIVREVKKRIDSRELGDIHYLYSQRLNLGRFRHDSDVLWTLAPHDISIINYWFESRPHQVSAQGITCIGKNSDIAEVCFAHLEYPDGRSAHLHTSWLDPQKKREIVIVGSKKMLIYDDMNTDRHIQIFDKRVEVEYSHPTDDFAKFTALIRAGDLVVPNVRLVEPLSVEVDHFVRCIQHNNSPLTDGRHGLDVITVLESLTHSMHHGGGVVSVEYYY